MRDTLRKAAAALGVITKTPHILKYLRAKDPKALEQAYDALAEVERTQEWLSFPPEDSRTIAGTGNIPTGPTPESVKDGCPEGFAEMARGFEEKGDWELAARSWSAAKSVSIGHNRRERYYQASKRCMEKAETELENSLKGILRIFTEGRNYDTQNPYTRPEVKRAMKELARRQGLNDYLDTDLSEK